MRIVTKNYFLKKFMFLSITNAISRIDNHDIIYLMRFKEQYSF